MAKDLISIKYTKGAITQIQNEVTLIAKIVNCIIQVSVAAYYAAMIALNVDDVFRIVLYSILLVVVLISYILSVFLTTHQFVEKERRREAARRKRRILLGFHLVNYAARIVAVSYAFYLIAVKGANQTTWILTIFSAVLILINAAVDGIGYLVRRYTNFLIVAIEADIEDSAVKDAYEKVTDPWKAISQATKRFADRMDGVRPEEDPNANKSTKAFHRLFGNYDDIEKAFIEEKQRQKEERKQANKTHRKQIRENLKRIFGIKKKEEEPALLENKKEDPDSE